MSSRHDGPAPHDLVMGSLDDWPLAWKNHRDNKEAAR